MRLFRVIFIAVCDISCVQQSNNTALKEPEYARFF